MRRLLCSIGMMVGAAHGVAAEPFTVPNKGALYCVDHDKLKGMVLAGLKGEKSSTPEGCGSVAPGVVGDAKIVSDEGGVKLGVGRFPGVAQDKTVSFIAIAAAPKKPFAERVFKSVSPVDVRNTPTKWRERDIAFSGVHVYWVDDDDVRFVTGTSVTVFASRVQGGELDAIKQRCETEKEALSAQCRVSIKFSYEEYDEDKPNGYSTRVVLKTSDLMIERPGGKARRR